jgi:hypothetical protein
MSQGTLLQVHSNHTACVVSSFLNSQTSLDAERSRADQAESAATALQREVADANTTMEEQQGLLEKVHRVSDLY